MHSSNSRGTCTILFHRNENVKMLINPTGTSRRIDYTYDLCVKTTPYTTGR